MEQITEKNSQLTEEQNKTDMVKKYIPFAWEVLKIFIIASVIVMPIRYFLFQPFIVKGESMIPNFQSGDYLIVDEISYKFKSPERGDIIVFKYPKDTSQKFIKRIIGLPGEIVEVKDEKVTIYKDGNSQVLDEKYLPNPSGTIGTIKLELGADEYFVLGDNREFSYDSRAWGGVPAKNIIGKVFLRVLPVAALSKITVPSY
ncbi:MAG: signal peptidase I [Candidatus Staskawiczbacteria bacterium]|nr:signal peptidase I [Candidatus Staskawiczbacteria bacterium]